MVDWVRVALFFGYFFGLAFGLPMLIGIVLQKMREPAFLFQEGNLKVRNNSFENPEGVFGKGTDSMADLRERFPTATAAAIATFPDGTWTLMIVSPDRQSHASNAKAFRRHYAVEKISEGRLGDVFKTAHGMHGLLVEHSNRIAAFFGLDERAAVARASATPGVSRNPRRTIGNVVFEDYGKVVFGAIVSWTLLQFVLFGRVASWAATVPAEASAAPVSMPEMKQRLLALSTQDLPFQVTPGTQDNEVLVDWRYGDARWFDLMRLHGMARVHRLVMRLDGDRRRVRVMEHGTSVDWSAGQGGLKFEWKAEYGIVFYAYRKETVLGFQIKEGRITFEPTYTYTFDLQALKRPIVEMVTSAGWSYAPVITFFRLIGG